MTINIPHNKTQQEVVDLIENGVNHLLEKGISGVQLTDPKKDWTTDASGSPLSRNRNSYGVRSVTTAALRPTL